ncbi:MAG: hypothetical protein K0U47_09570 [Epsilonproteobacteria bacterium]|nr:hypothetical protein [Campylobacterota bacterium]
MKRIIEIYKSNRDVVEYFISSSINRLNLTRLDKESIKLIYSVVKCTQLVYFVDNDYILRSSYHYKNHTSITKTGLSKSHYFEKIVFSGDGTYISNPYISSTNGTAGITYVIKLAEGYIVIDLNLLCVLEQLQLIQSNKFARMINKYIYGLMGFSLLFFALFLGLYAIYIFIVSFLEETPLILESTFQAIIALTLGLAIYDLAKTILEHEIFYKTLSIDEDNNNEVLSKFLKSIIIALSIESLMVVFKIALHDYKDMIHALFLILGVSLMIFALGKFNHLSRLNRHEK